MSWQCVDCPKCGAELETGDECGHIFETNVTGDLR